VHWIGDHRVSRPRDRCFGAFSGRIRPVTRRGLDHAARTAFGSKADLVRAALDQSIKQDLAPATDRALADEDPLHGLVNLIEAAMGLATRELNTLAAARNAGTLIAEVYTPFYEALTLLPGAHRTPAYSAATSSPTTCKGSWPC